MVAWFVRRLLVSAFSLFLAWLLSYTLVYYIYAGCLHCKTGYFSVGSERLERITQISEFDKPWPISYLAWLFDTDDPAIPIRGNWIYEPPTMQVSIGNLAIKGAGALTGDLGYSLEFRHGIPVMDVIGTDMGTVIVIPSAILLAFFLVAMFQRRNRLPAYQAARPQAAFSLKSAFTEQVLYPVDQRFLR